MLQKDPTQGDVERFICAAENNEVSVISDMLRNFNDIVNRKSSSVS